jgi:hypothetical protein
MYPREEEQEMCIEFWCGTAMKSGNFWDWKDGGSIKLEASLGGR